MGRKKSVIDSEMEKSRYYGSYAIMISKDGTVAQLVTKKWHKKIFTLTQTRFHTEGRGDTGASVGSGETNATSIRGHRGVVA